MSKDEIEQKMKELQSVLSQYKDELGVLETELFSVVSDYQKALEEEKVKEIKQTLQI